MIGWRKRNRRVALIEFIHGVGWHQIEKTEKDKKVQPAFTGPASPSTSSSMGSSARPRPKIMSL